MARFDSDSLSENIENILGTFSVFLNEFIGNNRNINRKQKIEIPEIAANATPSDKRKALGLVLTNIAETNPSSAIDDNDADNLVRFFDTLYAADGNSHFRHMYSEVCEIMYGFLSDGTNKLVEGVPDKAVQLANSLGIVVGKMESCNLESDSCKSTRKLLDHVNLELTRMQYMTEQNKAVMQAIRDNENSAAQYEEKIHTIEEENAKQIRNLGHQMELRLKTLQKEYIAILGIFSSIIIAFTSGMAFSSSVLQNIEKASIYRLSFILLLVGLFVFLMVIALFIFLNRISNINNDKMFQLLKWGAVLFVALIFAVLAARAIDVLSFFPIPIPL